MDQFSKEPKTEQILQTPQLLVFFSVGRVEFAPALWTELSFFLVPAAASKLEHTGNYSNLL